VAKLKTPMPNSTAEATVMMLRLRIFSLAIREGKWHPEDSSEVAVPRIRTQIHN